VGPGAFGCVGSVRTTNASDIADWGARVASTGSGVDTRQPLSNRDTVVETLAAGLRTRAGVDLRVLEARTGIDVLETHGTWIARLEADGLASTSGGRLRLSIDGVLVLDSLLLGFLDADAAPSAARR
jgi:coproporphyrinogen III oxidase-like Fe-S oxidoreductase